MELIEEKFAFQIVTKQKITSAYIVLHTVMLAATGYPQGLHISKQVCL
jgi:hypothetical protein